LSKSDGDAGANGERAGVSPAMTFGWMAAVVTMIQFNLGKTFQIQLV
jgi:hypothetical protein